MSDTQWSDWLRAALDERGWVQAEFVRQSEGHIKADRVSKWLSGKEKPSHKFAIIAANTLGKEHSEALRAAGFADAADGMDRRRSKLNEHLFMKPSQGLLLEMLKDVPDSEILRVLQLRAEKRESVALEATGVAAGNKTALDKAVEEHAKNVSGPGETIDPHEIDLSRGDVDLAASDDRSGMKDQVQPDYENESQDPEDNK